LIAAISKTLPLPVTVEKLNDETRSSIGCTDICGSTNGTPYGQKIETAQRRQRSNIFGLGPVLHNKLAVDA
jgi:hypothetical protein